MGNFKGKDAEFYSLVHPCCQNSVGCVLWKCSPAGAVLLVQSCCHVALGNPTDTAAEAAHREKETKKRRGEERRGEERRGEEERRGGGGEERRGEERRGEERGERRGEEREERRGEERRERGEERRGEERRGEERRGEREERRGEEKREREIEREKRRVCAHFLLALAGLMRSVQEHRVV
ncbi:hypothetical protein DUI87_15672 [Hirundo rustica rustica]|uniref:Uncharacterized protein n=1 Tax=Hirundo rustica rustica TaxID=333673 RepID=A0A3M0K1P1_HIRRU|nr:hypothetical protein DUI87_15672 [Hirundo rustica rustica]